MSRLKTKERISIIEAVDILSSISEMQSKVIVSDELSSEKDALHPERWGDFERVSENEELLKDVFDAVLYYFEQMESKHSLNLSDPSVQKGVEAILAILKESTEKLVKFTPLFNRGGVVPSLSELKEYKELIAFLDENVIPRLKKAKNKRVLKEESESEETEKEDIECKEDLEEIKNDFRYEFFYLKKENGSPFYDEECIRRLHLLYDFEKMGEESDEIVSNLKICEGKDFQKRAIAILVGADSLVRDFYKVAFQEKNNNWASSISKALMSLMLAATPHNLPSGTKIPKTASEYFSDFRGYLREAVDSFEYKRYSSASEGTSLEHKFALLTNKLCASYFLSACMEKEIVPFLKKLMGIGKKKLAASELLAKEDEGLREALHTMQGGPVKKIISAFLSGDFEEGWDPLAQQKTPCKIFNFKMNGDKVDVLHMPAPFKQTHLNKAIPAEEFIAFLEGYVREEKKSILFVDLQDSTSAEERARTTALDAFLESFDDTVSILRLPKKTDFYLQKNGYENGSNPKLFIKHLMQFVEIGGAEGFAFPKVWKKGELKSFTGECCSFVHECFFSSKKDLTVIERRDFLEIFYACLLLKTAELESPGYIAFVSKDGLDSAVSVGVEFFFVLKSLFFDHIIEEKDGDFLFWLLYAPVLTLRERAIHKSEAERVIRFMERIERAISKNGPALKKGLGALYKRGLITDVEISSG